MTEENPHWGAALDTFLSEDGIHASAKTEAVTRVVAGQLTDIETLQRATSLLGRDLRLELV